MQQPAALHATARQCRRHPAQRGVKVPQSLMWSAVVLVCVSPSTSANHSQMFRPWGQQEGEVKEWSCMEGRQRQKW